MLLFHRDLGGEGRPPMVILHGLLGSSRNWQTVGRELADSFHVCALDLRNHGESPWRDELAYGLMVEDVIHWMDHHQTGPAVLVGHSMGGKVAMRLACRHPERVTRLIAVDIAPRAYPATHLLEFEAMHALRLDLVESRTGAEELMKPLVADWGLRKFLLTNLERGRDGRFGWKVNVTAIEDAMSVLEDEPLEPGDSYAGPTLFLLGGKSGYFRAGDEGKARRHFPGATLVRIPEAGHNPHFDSRERFVEEVRRFLG
jgi:pimeloyl-ACP methyl ester carboxylesterase